MPPRKIPRPYQLQCCKQTFEGFQRGVRSGMIVLPTGGGKTYVASHFFRKVTDKLGGNILWVAHRHELLEQASDAFAEEAPALKQSWWDADKKDSSGDVVFAMIGSTKTLKKKFSYVFFDEGHHAAREDEEGYSNMYTKLLKQVSWGHLVGLSATPERLDGRDLLFEEIFFSIRFVDLVRMHRLSKPILVEMLTRQQYSLATRGGEYTKKSLQKLDNPVRNEAIAKEYVKNKARYGKSLFFVTSVEHCYNLRAAILKEDPSANVGIIHGNSKERKFPKKLRNKVTEWFDRGDQNEQKVLINCEVFTEGKDCPTIKSVWLCRPTMSQGLWMQMVGRGARINAKIFHCHEKHLVSREPAGTDGVEKLKFSNGAEYFGEDLGEAPGAEGVHAYRIHIDEEFYLVSVMDDITKFASLVKDWEMDLRELTPEELADMEEDQVLREKKMRIQLLAEDQQVSNPNDFAKMGDAQIRDLVGILKVSTYYHKEIGYPIDIERANCLTRLMEFSRGEQCTKANPAWAPNKPHEPEFIFDVEKFKQAFTFCVVRGEFPFRDFEIIRMAFYFKYIRHQSTVPFEGDGVHYQTWNFEELVGMTPESRKKRLQQCKLDSESALQLNEDFNKRYMNRPEALDLYQKVLDRTSDIISRLDKPRWTRSLFKKFSPTFELAKCRDRRITITARVSISSTRTMASLARLAHLMSIAMQEIEDDPNCLITISPERILITSKGTEVTSGEQY